VGIFVFFGKAYLSNAWLEENDMGIGSRTTANVGHRGLTVGGQSYMVCYDMQPSHRTWQAVSTPSWKKDYPMHIYWPWDQERKTDSLYGAAGTKRALRHISRVHKASE
jgi:hypothetical protein